MFVDKQFGVAFVSHVLEHLSPDKMQKAMDELRRIAERCIILYPAKGNILARFQRDHNNITLAKLWKMSGTGVLAIKDRQFTA